MLFYFKKYLNNVAPAITAGSFLGFACGSVAGVVGLHQMCAGYSGSMALDACNSIEPLINPDSEKAACVAGAIAGSAIGFAAGAIVYPLYDGFIGWCKRDIERRINPEAVELEAQMVRP